MLGFLASPRILTRDRPGSLLRTVRGRKIKDGMRKRSYRTISSMNRVAKVLNGTLANVIQSL